MAGSSTVPQPNTQLPSTVTNPNADPGYVVPETSPTIIKQANTTARAKLKEKNRKQNEFKLEMPINLSFEEATVWQLQGFTPDADAHNWVLVEVELHVSGKKGSTTNLTFQRGITEY